MNDNPVIREVRNARKEILREHGGDLRRMLKALQKKQSGRGARLIKLSKQEESVAEDAKRYNPS